MPQIDIRNLNNEKVGTMELSERLFGAAVNKSLLHETVVMQRAAMRQGTASTKTRGEVSGGGKKPWRQKGTGRARAGSNRSPIWRGGAIIFGPRPRDYGYGFPKKKYRAALQGALSAKFAAGEVLVLDRLDGGTPKTGELADRFKALGLTRRVLVVVDGSEETFERAARNLPQVELITVPRLNVYDVLAHRHLVIPKTVIERMQEVWA
jgi:large subunit ribosomal protein L4